MHSNPKDIPQADKDPIEATGCEIQNNSVLLCYAETKDWRKCRKELEEFKLCMERFEAERKNKRP